MQEPAALFEVSMRKLFLLSFLVLAVPTALFAQRRAATPYVVVSAGGASLDPDIAGTTAENRFSASGGIGVKVPFNRNAGLRVEARGYYTTLPNDNTCRRCSFDNTNRDFYQG